MLAALEYCEGKKKTTTKPQTQRNFQVTVMHQSSKISHENLLVCAGKLRFLVLGLVCTGNY